MKFYKDYNNSYELDYKDVFIVPQYSRIESRKKIDTSSKIILGKIQLDVPVFSANMSSVTEHQMCIAMYQAGGMGVMHRFMSIEENLEEYNKVKLGESECFVSIGVNEESKERAKQLYNIGARYFCIDIAHGNSKLMKEMISWLRINFCNDLIIMAGNIADPSAIMALKTWGADIAKVGIGPGSVCLTKNQTAVTFPQFQAVLQCVEEGKKWNMPVVADGGIKEYGDICRAIGAGACAVMAGGLFAGCLETPGEVDANGNKAYFGMASKRAMKLIKREEDMATPEGKEIAVKATTESAKTILKDIKGALQSSMSYSDSSSIEDFQNKVIFGIRNV